MGAHAAQRLDSREQRLRAQHHAGSPTVRVIVDGSMPSEAMLTQVVDRHAEQPVVHRSTDDTGLQRCVEEFWEERDDIDAHRRQRTSSDA